jgi:hypothetical protein
MADERQYNAPTGYEMKTIILREIGRALDAADIRDIARTFPLAEWSWDLTITQKNKDGKIADDTIVYAGTPFMDLAIKESKGEVSLKIVSGGSQRFKNHPPSPTEIREAEKLPLPEA